MTDVAMTHESDGGNVEVVGGRFTISNGLFNAVYLSLFGGNERDSGEASTDHLEWWGNKGEENPTRRYRSEFQAILKELPLVPSNRTKFENAATRDLAWMTEEGPADFVGVEASIPGLNRLALVVRIELQGEQYAFTITHGGQ